MSDTARRALRAWAGSLLLAGLSWLAAGCPPKPDDGRIVVEVSGERQPQAATAAEIRRAAEQEGEFSWYTSLPNDVAQGVLGKFQAKYPAIRTQLRRGSTFDLISMINAQLDKGELEADALHVLDICVFIDLKRKGQLLKYSSPEDRGLPPQFREDDYWGAMRIVVLCMAYNRTVLKASQAPRTWEDLLEARFANGKIGLKDPRTAGSAYAEYYFLRDRYGSSFWERLGKQKPQVLSSSSDAIAALVDQRIQVAGEMVSYQAYEAQKEGKPIEIIWPTDGVPVIPGPVAILQSARHVNAAKLFVDFVLSREGQEFLQEVSSSYSARPDVPSPAGRPRLGELKQMIPIAGWEDYLDRQPLYHSEFRKFFGLED